MDQLDWLLRNSQEMYGFRGPPFPQKLFAAMNAPRAVIQWTNDGKAISIDAEHYERNVMCVHPGLVEISSFANFRRLMREYAFDWQYHPETRDFEFSHASFQRGRPELLSGVLTRRKRQRKHAVSPSVGTRLRSTSSLPRRCSVLSYAGVAAQRDRDPPRAISCVGRLTPDVGRAKSLDELTDEEWWKYCVPAIVSGMNENISESVTGWRPRQAVENRFTTPLFFCCDDDSKNTENAECRWTHRVLDFDEL